MYDLKPMEFGDIFNYTFRILRHKFFYLYIVMGWLYLPVAVIYNFYNFLAVGDSLFGSLGQTGTVVGFDTLLHTYLLIALYLIIDQILQPLTGAGAVKIVAQTLHGEEIVLADIFRSIFSRWNWLKLLAVGAVVTVSVSLGALALLLPALLFYVTFSLVTQVAMLEGGGVWRALSRSWAMVWKDIGRVILVLLVMTVLTYFVSSVVTAPITVITMVLTFLQVDQTIWYLLLSLISSVLGLLVAPVPVIAMTLLYFDLRARREGVDLVKRIETVSGRE